MKVIEAPSLAPAKGGLLSVVPITETDGAGGILYNGLTYETYLCGGNRPVPAEGVEKSFDKQTVIESEPFSIYRGVEDDILVSDNSQAEALRAFKAGESYALEWKLQELVLLPQAYDLTPTPGTPVTNLRYAVGMLEQYAQDNYSGLPLIHGNRVATTMILPELEAGENGVLHTIHGTPVANGGGYYGVGPGAVAAGDGEAWLYISGQVNIWRGPIDEYTAYDLKGNRAYALAEATYVATVECFVAAILVGI